MQSSEENTAALLVNFIHKYLIWLIVGSYGIAAFFPEVGLWMRGVDLGKLFVPSLSVTLPPLMLAMLLFNAGFGVRSQELREAPRKAPIMLAAFFGNIAAPMAVIVAVSLTMTLWHNQEEVQQLLVGLALVAAMPIAGASTAWAQNANGDLALSLGLVLCTTLVSPLTTPAILHAVGFVTTGDYSEDLHELAGGEAAAFLGMWVMLPSVLGIAMRQIVGERRFVLASPYVKLFNFLVLVLLNYSNATLVLPKVAAQPDADLLAVVVTLVSVLCVSGFSAGFLLARALKSDCRETASLMFALGMNNNGTGLVLATIALEDHPQVMLPIILYNLVQHLFASMVDFGLLRLNPHGTPELHGGRPAIGPTLQNSDKSKYAA